MALIAIVAAAIGYAITARLPKTYTATAELLFAPRSNPLTALGVGAGPLDQGSAVANNALDVASFDVARATARALGDPRYDADTVHSDISVGAKGGDVIAVASEADSPQAAARLVNTYIHQYIRSTRRTTLRETRQARAALVESLNTLPPSVRDTPRGDTLRQQIGQLDVYQRIGHVTTILQGVRAQDSPVGPPTVRNTLFGLLFGAVLGIGLVAARNAMRPTRRDF